MKKINLLSFAIVAIISLGFLSSCKNDEKGLPDQKSYAQALVGKFGVSSSIDAGMLQVKSQNGMIDSFLGGKAPKKQVEDTKKAMDLASFEEKRSQLEQRTNVIVSGLGGIGIRSSQLKTDEVVELFYKTFNPGDISQGIKLQ